MATIGPFELACKYNNQNSCTVTPGKLTYTNSSLPQSAGSSAMQKDVVITSLSELLALAPWIKFRYLSNGARGAMNWDIGVMGDAAQGVSGNDGRINI